MEQWREAENATMEAHGRAEAIDVEVKLSKGVFTKAKANLTPEKGKRKVEVTEAKKRMAKAKQRAKERFVKASLLAMEAYKASADFAAEKAWEVEAFKMSEKFYDARIKFSKDAFRKGHKLG